MSSSTTTRCKATYCNLELTEGEKCHDCAYISSQKKCLNKYCEGNLTGEMSTNLAVSSRKDGLCQTCHDKHVKQICRYKTCREKMVRGRKDHFCEEHHPFENRPFV